MRGFSGSGITVGMVVLLSIGLFAKKQQFILRVYFWRGVSKWWLRFWRAIGVELFVNQLDIVLFRLVLGLEHSEAMRTMVMDWAALPVRMEGLIRANQCIE